MIKKIVFFIFTIIILAIIAAAAFFIMNNETPLDISFYEGYELKKIESGQAIAFAFFSGILIAGLMASFLMFLSFIKRKKVEFDKNKKEKLFTTIIDAREARESGDWERAKMLWSRLKKQDSSQLLSNIEISKVLEAEGKVNEAIKVIDQARSVAPDNVEVLLRASDLHVSNNNKTAALDNLALILSKKPNLITALKARDLSYAVGRLEDALEYNEKALEIGSVADFKKFNAKVELEILNQQYSAKDKDTRASYKKALKKFLKKYKDNTAALSKLAEIEQKDEKIENATEALYKAASSSKDSKFWHQAIQIWLKNQNPDRALATAKLALKNSTGINRAKAELDLIRVNLVIGRAEDAQTAIGDFPDLLVAEEVEATAEIKQDYHLLKSLCLNQLGQHAKADQVLAKLCDIQLLHSNNGSDSQVSDSESATKSQ